MQSPFQPADDFAPKKTEKSEGANDARCHHVIFDEEELLHHLYFVLFCLLSSILLFLPPMESSYEPMYVCVSAGVRAYVG